jgi:hypothetical protein
MQGGTKIRRAEQSSFEDAETFHEEHFSARKQQKPQGSFFFTLLTTIARLRDKPRNLYTIFFMNHL